MDFDAIIFDCDGVLVDSEVISIHGERAALAGMGLDYAPEEFVQRFVGLHDDAYFAQLEEDYRRRAGALASPDFIGRVLAGRRREAHLLAPVAGALEALAGARARAGKIAVASSSRAAPLQDKLRRTGLWEASAPHVYSADFVAAGKPAPDVFLYAAEKLGASPSRCLVLEDSVNGVKAGLAAGMTVWGFTGGGHCHEGYGERLGEAGADRIVSSHAAFLAAIGPTADRLPRPKAEA